MIKKRIVNVLFQRTSILAVDVATRSYFFDLPGFTKLAPKVTILSSELRAMLATAFAISIPSLLWISIKLFIFLRHNGKLVMGTYNLLLQIGMSSLITNKTLLKFNLIFTDTEAWSNERYGDLFHISRLFPFWEWMINTGTKRLQRKGVKLCMVCYCVWTSMLTSNWEAGWKAVTLAPLNISRLRWVACLID